MAIDAAQAADAGGGGRRAPELPVAVEARREEAVARGEHGEVLLAEGDVRGREAAEALVGEQLLVLASDRPKLARGEFHLLDLIGLEVRLLEQGQSIGRVLDLLHAGNDLLEVELNAEWGARVILIPFVKAIVPEVQIQAGWIGITPPPGLLEL